jgi:hypothetical protein
LSLRFHPSAHWTLLDEVKKELRLVYWIRAILKDRVG